MGSKPNSHTKVRQNGEPHSILDYQENGFLDNGFGHQLIIIFPMEIQGHALRVRVSRPAAAPSIPSPGRPSMAVAQRAPRRWRPGTIRQEMVWETWVTWDVDVGI